MTANSLTFSIRTAIGAVWLGFALLPTASWGQATPTAEQMIEQLKAQPAATTAPAGGPRTRGLTRNLAVEAAPPASTGPVAAGGAGASPVTGGAGAAVPPPVSRPSLSLLIQFDFNSARVKPESQQALSNLAQALQSKELAQSRFAVEGHTDAKGRPDYNQRLSQSRADAVRDFLGQQGVDVARLVASGKGASELANVADPLAPENRRVRIVNLD